jgi:hypothetical protein
LGVAHGDGHENVRDVVLISVGEQAWSRTVERGDLVLCMGPDGDGALPRTLRQLSDLGVAAVAVAADSAGQPDVIALAEEQGLCLLSVPPSAGWAQLVWLLIGLMEAAPDKPHEGPASSFGELFTLADALEGALGGPVTIEDAASRVLAHSARQEGADPARLSTIVGRRVPAELTERFRSTGVLRALQRSDEPVHVPSWGPGISPRLVIPIRAGRELLGSIWAAVDHDVPPEGAADLQRMVSLLALHLLRLRAQEDLVGRLEAERLRGALTGGSPSGWAPPGHAPWRVVALAENARTPSLGHAERWRSVLRWNGWRTPLVTEVDGLAFALVDAASGATPGSWEWLVRTTATGLVAASSPVHAAAGLADARVEAAEVMQVLRTGPIGSGHGATGGQERQVIAAEDAWAALVVSRAVATVGDAGGGRGSAVADGPVGRLLAHDAENGTDLARTLAAHLAHPGDPRAAAARLHVHPNTFRYRMRKIAEIAPVDLDDELVRLAVQLQLLAALR